MIPTAIFLDEQGKQIRKEELADMGAEELGPWFIERGFVLKDKPYKSQAKPTHSATFRGRVYEFYETLNTYPHAQEISSLSHPKNGAHMLALEDQEKADFVFENFFQNGKVGDKGVWLAVSDSKNEGEWEWTAGKLSGQVFWHAGRFEENPKQNGESFWVEGSAQIGLFNAWSRGEPNQGNQIEDEDCAVARPEVDYLMDGEVEVTGAHWHDVPCRSKAGLIIEYTPHQDL